MWHFGMHKKLLKIVQVRHHDAHAAIFFVSPFEEAAVLVMDGHGDETAQSAYIGSGNRLQRLWQSEVSDSLGFLYMAVTAYLGFKPFAEGTVMALAGTGGPSYAKKFRELVRLEPEGRFSINRDLISYNTHGVKKPFKEWFTEAFGPPRQPNEPISDRHRDLAFALQSTIEETVVHIARALSKRHPSRNLCLTGGVALNCVANARILRDTDYESVWVPPCASDSGAPLGSALWHYHQTLGHPRGFELKHSFFGRGYTDAEITSALQAAGLAYRRMSEEELLATVARDVAAGKIVGWFQGRSELGPRALGNRSILADPRDEAMKDRINARVKHREPFRPFAPAILQERAAEFFEIEQIDPFMTMAPRVRPDKARSFRRGSMSMERRASRPWIAPPTRVSMVSSRSSPSSPEFPSSSTRASTCRSRSCSAPRMPSRAICAPTWMCWCSAISTLLTGNPSPGKPNREYPLMALRRH